MISSPFCAVSSLPLSVKATSSGFTAGVSVSAMGGGLEGRLGGARLDRDLGPGVAGDVRLELVPEALDGRRDRRHRARAERTDRGLLGRPRDAGADVVGDVHQQVEVLGPAVAVEDALEDLLQPAGALAARRALAARLA